MNVWVGIEGRNRARRLSKQNVKGERRRGVMAVPQINGTRGYGDRHSSLAPHEAGSMTQKKKSENLPKPSKVIA